MLYKVSALTYCSLTVYMSFFSKFTQSCLNHVRQKDPWFIPTSHSHTHALIFNAVKSLSLATSSLALVWQRVKQYYFLEIP